MKKATSLRIEEEQLKQLNKIVNYYQMKHNTIEVKTELSKANVVEMLIKEKYNQLILNNEIN